MRAILTLTILALTSVSLFAQGANTAIIKQRAREVSGNKQPPIPPPMAVPATAAPAGPAIPSASISRLGADLAVIKIRPEATAEQKQKLAQDLMACVVSGNRPSPDDVTKLASNLAAAVAGKTIPAQSQTLLARQLAAMMNGSSMTPPALNAAIAATSNTLTSIGATPEQLQAITKDLQTVTGVADKTATKTTGK